MHCSIVIRGGLSRDLSEHVQEIVKLGPVVFDPCAQTDRQTDTLIAVVRTTPEGSNYYYYIRLTAFFQDKVGKRAPER